MSDFIDFDPEGDEVVNREVIEHNPPSTDRSHARRVTLQALYEVDSVGHAIGRVLNNLLTHSVENSRVKGYVTRLAKGVDSKQNDLDTVLQKYAPEWPISQVAVIDRNILRIALYEMAVTTQIPIGVAIDEAMELAKLYGAENTLRFINGVLGSIADNLEEVRLFLASETAPTVENENTDE
ncbi:MAG: transcription antitermination factor NusB [Anaerolineae bacterium]|nr:transcription antitermination factor NusB [Anaerolineae bacterium]MDQ7034815.1 transcription antitermination factor NusB [Anaerolineae bacterium]